MYYKELMPSVERKDLTSLKKCIATEIMINNEKFSLFAFAGHQNYEQLDSYCSNFKNLPDNINNSRPVSSVIVGDFNVPNGTQVIKIIQLV